MKIPNAVTAAMIEWIDEGCDLSEDGELPTTKDMRGMLRTMLSRKPRDQAIEAMKVATLGCAAFDVAAGGESVIAMKLLAAVINDGIDWHAIVDKYTQCPEMN